MADKRIGVIVVHGTMGSALQKEGKKVWPINNADFVHYDRSLLPLDNGIEPSHLLITYKMMLEFLNHNFDVVKDFIYDWRLNNLEHTSLLKDTIRTMDVDEVHIVAHSMGGIISKLCINEFKEEPEIKKIKKLITIGTPWKGSMESVKTLLYGSRVPQKYLTYINKETSKHVSPKFPSVYQLLPNEEFLNYLKSTNCVPYFLNDKYFDSFNEFFEGVLQEEFLKYHIIEKTFNEYYDLLKQDLPEDIELHEIIGAGKPTIRMICENTRSEPDAHYAEGDGTVPLFSAYSNLTDRRNYFPYFVNKGSHVGMTSNPLVIGLVKKIIKGEEFVPNYTIFNDLSSSYYKPFNGYISKIACPVEISIKDKDGRIIYGDIETINDEEIKELLQVDYSIEDVGSTTYVIFDDESDTNIANFEGMVIDAYAQGLTSVGLDKYENGELVSKKAFKTFEIKPELQAELILNKEEAGSSSLILKQDKRILDTLKLDELLVNDSEVKLPDTTISFAGDNLIHLKEDDVYLGKDTLSLNVVNVEEGTFKAQHTFVIINNHEFLLEGNSLELNEQVLSHGKNKIEYFTVDEYDYTEVRKVVTFYYFHDIVSKVELFFNDKFYTVKLSEDEIYEAVCKTYNLTRIEYPNYKFDNEDGVTGYQVVYHDLKRKLQVDYVDIFDEELNMELTIDEDLARKIIKGAATVSDVEEFTKNLNAINPKYQFRSNKSGNHQKLNDANLNRAHTIEIIDDNIDVKIIKNVELEVSFESLSEHIYIQGEHNQYEFAFKVMDIDQQYVRDLDLAGKITFTINDPSGEKNFTEEFKVEYMNQSASYKFTLDTKVIKELIGEYWNPKDKILSVAVIEIVNNNNEATIRSLEVKIAQ